MAKKKKDSIAIKDIKSFDEIRYIQSLLIRDFNGKMPMNMFNGFLKVITNPYIKDHFVSTFKPLTNVKPPQPQQTNKKHKSPDTSTTTLSYRRLAKRSTNYNKVYTVKATDFSFQHSFSMPNLVFLSNKTFFFAESKWFDKRVLKSITRTFNIKLNKYTGFSFIPYSDKEVFRNLLEQAYLNFERKCYEERLNNCINTIEKYLYNKIYIYVNSFRHFRLKTNFNDYYFNEEKQTYIFNVDVLKHLNIVAVKHVNIPLSTILSHISETERNKFLEEITKKWPNGYNIELNVDSIYPNHSSLFIPINIPKIYINNYVKANPIEIEMTYSIETGRFNTKILSLVGLNRYYTNTSEVTFSNDIKESLINIIRNIDSNFIITFYSAFIRMFNEGDSVIQSIFKNKIESAYGHHWFDNQKYNSGFYPLLEFDSDNTDDWRWLTKQMIDGVFSKAYSFNDKDETFSSKVGDTIKYPVKVYLTIKDANVKMRNLWGPYMIIISMYALDTAKSTYRFVVDSNKVNQALFFIWSYFSSNIYNKRQDYCLIQKLQHLFGIRHLYKDKPLVYYPDLGYCESPWAMDY